MKLDKSGLLMVGAAAVVLLMVVKKSTPAGTPAQGGQAAIGANAASWLSNAISNLGGTPSTNTSFQGVTLGGMTLFPNGTFSSGGTYVDPGQVTYNSNTGQVTESPFSGMYNVMSPGSPYYGMV